MTNSKNRLVSLFKSLKANDNGDKIAELIIQRYSSPNRYYHNLDHIIECIEELDKIIREGLESVFLIA